MGDMSNIGVDFGAISGAAGDIDSQAKQIDQQLDDLHRQIQQLEEIWQGSAGEGFQNTKRQWMNSAKDLQQTLASIGSAVNLAHENYMQTEAKNAGRW